MNRYLPESHSSRAALRWMPIAFAFGALGGCGGNSTPALHAAATPGTDAASTTSQLAAITAAVRASGIVTARNACELLIRADAEAAVGQPLPQNTTANISLGTCDYNATNFSAGASITVGSWESIKNAATSGRIGPTTISGIGDEALNLNSSNGSTVYVRRGDEGFLLILNGPKIDSRPDHGLEQEESLALKILARFQP